jgi:Uncharacterised nucleotidyltransferase
MPTGPTSAPNTEWVFKQFLYEDALRDLDRHFQLLNVGYMPIKGAYLICTGQANQVRSRSMIDIDILVRESDFDAVISHFSTVPGAAVAEKSWPVYKKGWPFEVTFYYQFEGWTLNIDIHKLINLRQRFSLPPEMLFIRGTKQGLRTLPCVEDALAICVCHAFSHIATVFPDFVFDDIALLIGTSMDWNKFWKIARSTGIEAFIYYILKMFEKKRTRLPTPFPRKTLRFVYADILLGVTGHRGLSTLPRMMRRIFIELPLCRDPAGLVWDKYARSRIS